MAKSGISSAKLLKNKGADVTIQDIKNIDSFSEIEEKIENLRSLGIKFLLGENPDKTISEYQLIVVSPGVPSYLSFFQAASQFNIPILSEVELAYKLCPSENIIAITGTNGKTTTTSLVYEIMKNFSIHTELVGNIGIPFTSKVNALKKESIIVSELSSFQLEFVHEFRPKVSAVLNITPDHLDRHKTFENYCLAKENIFKNQLQSDFTVLNFDCDFCRNMKERSDGMSIFFSAKTILKNGVFVKDNSVVAKIRELNIDSEIININKIRILGSHNIENVLCSIAISLAMKVPIPIIESTISLFTAVPHRIEYVCTKNNIEFYNDSKATNPDAAIKGILAMKRPIVLICGGSDKSSDFDEWVKMFRGKVKFAIVIGQCADKMIKTFNDNNFHTFNEAETFEEAINLAYMNSIEGDCVLLSPSCASYGMFNNFEERGDLFKKIVKELQ